MSMVGRRGLLKTLGLAPLARTGKHKHTPKGGEPVGWNNQNVFAQLVIIYGNGELGLFIYNGQPTLGNPPVAWATPDGVTEDPSGNALPVSGGFAVQNPAGSHWSLLASGQLVVTNSLNYQPGSIGSTVSAGQLELFSATVNAGDVPAQMILISQDSVAGGQPQVALNQTALFLGELASAPATALAGGFLYTDSTGHLHYLGPGGTNTILAGP